MTIPKQITNIHPTKFRIKKISSKRLDAYSITTPTSHKVAITINTETADTDKTLFIESESSGNQ